MIDVPFFDYNIFLSWQTISLTPLRCLTPTPHDDVTIVTFTDTPLFLVRLMTYPLAVPSQTGHPLATARWVPGVALRAT